MYVVAGAFQQMRSAERAAGASSDDGEFRRLSSSEMV
jgi:hypothetical protein